MESYDIANIDEIITDWYFSKVEALEKLGFEFNEINKDEENCTFDFTFKIKRGHWHLKYEYASFYFEVDGDLDNPLAEK